MVQNGQLLHYLAIGRIDPEGKKDTEFLASKWTKHGEKNHKMYQENAQKIFDKAKKLDDKKRLRLTSENEYEIHVLCEKGKNTLIFVAVTDVSFGAHHNIPTFVEEFKAVFAKAVPKDEWAASKSLLHKRANDTFNQIINKYNTSQLLTAQSKVDQVKGTMVESLQIAIDNTERIEAMDQRTEELESKSKEFYNKSSRLQCCLHMQSLQIIIMLLVIAFVIVTIVVVGLTAGGGGGE